MSDKIDRVYFAGKEFIKLIFEIIKKLLETKPIVNFFERIKNIPKHRYFRRTIIGLFVLLALKLLYTFFRNIAMNRTINKNIKHIGRNKNK